LKTFSRGRRPRAQPELDVALDRQVRKQHVVLENGADVALVGPVVIDGDAVQVNLARGGRLEARDQA
jgi:hypothetical protein